MKLRNKKTGEIRYLKLIYDDLEPQEGEWTATASLAELNEEWEDYEERKRGWFINDLGNVFEDFCLGEGMQEAQRSIGNYFETEEEAEKAVEKLKAWKWLKDNGVSLKYDKDKFVLHIVVSGKISPNQWRTGEYMQKLDLLFGGEE